MHLLVQEREERKLYQQEASDDAVNIWPSVTSSTLLDPSPHGQNPVQSTSYTIEDQSTGLYTSATPVELSPEQGTLYRSLVKRWEGFIHSN